ncbi:ankyrin repeat domain-containing protein [Spiroplasma ixodetis]|uniref:ankyrin repeat domain-containing protein n=1 Tax=Spiroplasma ixodetis TaxID=2141 RepID=UPI003307B163
MDIVKILIKNDININHENNVGQNALIWAAKEGHLDVVKTLLINDVDVTHLDANGDSALTWAIRNGHLEIKNIINETINWKEQINSINLQNHSLPNKYDKLNSFKI